MELIQLLELRVDSVSMPMVEVLDLKVYKLLRVEAVEAEE